MTEQSYLSLAARLLCISIDQLWDYQEGRDGIAFRTSDGYPHRFSFKELESEQTGLPCSKGRSAHLSACDNPEPGVVSA
jgi:hypothetical protein